jgi:hypothetical protein
VKKKYSSTGYKRKSTAATTPTATTNRVRGKRGVMRGVH